MLINMHRWTRGVIIAVSIAVCAMAALYVLLDNFYGSSQTDVYAQFGGQEPGLVVPRTTEEVEESASLVLTYEDNELVTDT